MVKALTDSGRFREDGPSTRNHHATEVPHVRSISTAWKLLEDGRVRQFFEEQDEQGEWQVWFEGFYSRTQ